MTDRPAVLFVCVHNAGRSQMAAGYLTALAGGAIEVRSAGSAPGTQVNPVAVAAMAEEGIDISTQTPKILTTESVQASDVVIAMGCGDACPLFPGKRYEDWVLEDPAGQGIDTVRRVRDDIKARVQTLIGELLPAGGRPVNDTLHEVVIVGSGPAGYTAAIYCARAGLNPIVVAGSIAAGGALMTTTEVENFPGFAAGIQGPELMAQLQEQAERFGARVLADDATAVDLTGDVKTVTTADHGTLRARAVILATGSGYRKIGLADEERLSGRGVSWCATCDGFFFRGQDIAVVGGGDSAMEEAMFLTRFANSVTVVHRRHQLRASKIMASRAHANDKIRFALGHEITAIHGDDAVTGITLTDTTTGATQNLPVTAVFVAIGHDPRTELIATQIDLDDVGYVAVQGRTTLTNQPGVFACGDVVDHSYRQAITAAGSGCAAALDAERYLAALDDPALNNAALSSL